MGLSLLDVFFWLCFQQFETIPEGFDPSAGLIKFVTLLWLDFIIT
jgi:hypothetical protein